MELWSYALNILSCKILMRLYGSIQSLITMG